VTGPFKAAFLVGAAGIGIAGLATALLVIFTDTSARDWLNVVERPQPQTVAEVLSSEGPDRAFMGDITGVLFQKGNDPPRLCSYLEATSNTPKCGEPSLKAEGLTTTWRSAHRVDSVKWMEDVQLFGRVEDGVFTQLGRA
jgi:hypothetical protein